MLIHFIGGKMHGRSESVTSPPPIVKVPVVIPGSVFAVREGEEDFGSAGYAYETHEYRITKRTRRYCIAEYIAPKVMATAEVRLEVSTWEHEALDALSRWCCERRVDAGQPGDTKLVAVLAECTGQVTLQFQTLVDGPADAAAAAEAGENVQTFLDRYLPEKVRLAATITQSGVSVE